MEFERARSRDQKEMRMAEIKKAADELFHTLPYHEITLTVIAEKLSWSRANLYKYVNTKEEIYLSLSKDKRDGYFTAMLAAFPEGVTYSREVIAEVWAGILNVNRDYLSYSEILTSIIETNVSLELLAQYKKNYYEDAKVVSERLAGIFKTTERNAYSIMMAIYYHALGLNSICYRSPLIRKAIELAEVDAPAPDFIPEMKSFISIMLTGSQID